MYISIKQFFNVIDPHNMDLFLHSVREWYSKETGSTPFSPPEGLGCNSRGLESRIKEAGEGWQIPFPNEGSQQTKNSF